MIEEALCWALQPVAAPIRPLAQPAATAAAPPIAAGWWHCVLNLDQTVAVTQNYVSLANLEAAVQWQALGAGQILGQGWVVSVVVLVVVVMAHDCFAGDGHEPAHPL